MATATMMPPALIAARDVCQTLKVSLSKLRVWNREGRLPRPVIRNRTFQRWNHAELLAWIDAGCPTRAEWETMKAGKV